MTCLARRRTETRVLGALREPLARNASPDASVAVVCVIDDRRAAELASQHLAAGLEAVGIQTDLRLWSNGQRWVDFTTGRRGI